MQPCRPSASAGLIVIPAGSVTTASRRSGGASLVGSVLRGTWMPTCSPDGAPACVVSAVTVAVGAKRSLSQPVIWTGADVAEPMAPWPFHERTSRRAVSGVSHCVGLVMNAAGGLDAGQVPDGNGLLAEMHGVRCVSCDASAGLPHSVSPAPITGSCALMLRSVARTALSSGRMLMSIGTVSAPAKLKANRAGWPSLGSMLKTGTVVCRAM